MRSAINLALKIPQYQLFRLLGYPRLLPVNYTLLISTVCNSRCKTCNIWKQRHQDFDMAEWQKTLRSLNKSPFWVTVSGGEPFIQPHLADLVIMIDRICQPAIINIPTNSLLTAKITATVEKILKQVKTPRLIINLSLDGVGGLHDQIRGVAGNFEKVMENYQNLKQIQKKYSNLTLGFGSVLSKYNLAGFSELVDFVYSRTPDQYLSEIAEERVELGTKNTAITPSLRNYSHAIDYLINKMQTNKFQGVGRISRAFRLEYYQFVKNWLKKKPLLPDYAGFASVEITSWGEVWPSCINGEPMGNLRQANYDFAQVWFSPAAAQIRRQIKSQGTSYPLANAFYTSSLEHYPTLWRVFKNIIFG